MSFRGKLFSLILLIMAVNVVILLFMGTTLFKGFYQRAKIDDLERSAQRIKEAYIENSEDVYEEITQIEDQNVLVSLFQRDSEGNWEMSYHSRTAKLSEDGIKYDWMPPLPELQRELDRQMEQVQRQLESADDSLQVQQVKTKDLRPELTLTTKLDDRIYLYLQTPQEYIESVAALAVHYTALISISILAIGSVPIYFLLNRVTKPVREVQRVAQQISQLDFSQPGGSGGPAGGGK